MSIQPTNLGAAIAGSHAAQQVRATDAERKNRAKDKRPDPRKDEVDLSVARVENEQAIRNLKDGSQEEAREDKQAQGDAAPHPDNHPHLDLNA